MWKLNLQWVVQSWFRKYDGTSNCTHQVSDPPPGNIKWLTEWATALVEEQKRSKIRNIAAQEKKKSQSTIPLIAIPERQEKKRKDEGKMIIKVRDSGGKMELFMLPWCRGRRLSGCLNTENKHPRSVGIEGRKKKSVINSYFICRYTNDQNDDCGALCPERQVIGL